MTWTKTKIAGVVALVALMGATTVVTFTMNHSARMPHSAESHSDDWIWEFNSQTLERVPPMLVLRQTQMPNTWSPAEMFGNGRYLARGKTLKELITTVYSQKNSSLKIIFEAPMPGDRFDCIVTLQTNHWPDALEGEIDRRFNLRTEFETRDGVAVAVVKQVD
jgi:hypothetical protein